MANQEHLEILKQGVKAWNQWRKGHTDIESDLSGAYLSEADLSEAELWGANLHGAYLPKANLSGADLRDAELFGAYLSEANLRGAALSEANLSRAGFFKADLSGADLRDADLSEANLSRADLRGADLGRANLFKANLNYADLSYADLKGTYLSGATLSGASIGWTIFGEVDLSEVKELETVRHLRPSTIGIDTIIRSQGNIPEIFLRHADIPDAIIEAIPSLIGALSPIDFYSCFISYSSKDQDFAERLYTDLQSKGVRCWLDKEDLKIGEKFRPRIDEAIRRHDKLLLVLSQNSVKSVWVEKEVETAFEKERQYKRLVLFPIRLDEAVMRTRQAWSADIRRQRNIGNFTSWKDHDAYLKAFARLLRDLKAEAQKMGSRDATTNDR